MSSRYYTWLANLADRDLAFVEMAGLSLLIILAWLGINYLPTKIQPWLRKTYLVGGVILYFVTIYLTLEMSK